MPDLPCPGRSGSEVFFRPGTSVSTSTSYPGLSSSYFGLPPGCCGFCFSLAMSDLLGPEASHLPHRGNPSDQADPRVKLDRPRDTSSPWQKSPVAETGGASPSAALLVG